MPRYRVVFFTDTDDENPVTGRDFTADAFIIDGKTEAILFLEHTAEGTSIITGAVAPGTWQTIDKVADTRPALEVKAEFGGIAEGLTPPPMVDTDGVRVTHLVDTPDDGDDQ